MFTRRSGQWRGTLFPILTLALLLALQLPAGPLGAQTLREMGSGFREGFNSGRGGSSLRDRAIEGLIESVTPQATEEQRRIQRGAVRQATSINRESQRRAAQETQRATRDYIDSRTPPRSQGQPRS